MDESTDDSTPGNEPAKNEPMVIGIGASAGGLAALKTFFANVPEKPGAAFVVVVHLSPDHQSHLAELLQPHVRLPVRQVSELTPLEKDHVYVIPPGRNLSTIDTHLRLTSLEARRLERAPIDHFFRTLADSHDGNSIGIILTGTGSDGALGVKEIKARGGLTIVQDPAEADYDGMPRSAIATGLVDFILPLAEIPKAALGFGITQPKLPIPSEQDEVDVELQRVLQKVFAQIHARTGRDFSRYKRSTILRRIARRMQMRQLVQLEDYLKVLRESPQEVTALSDDLLITVTSFFRDPEVYALLEQEVIPRCLERKKPDEGVRVWTVGCASGEEAYSLAILLLEAVAKLDIAPQIQIFASDLHEHSLANAREGLYPADIETDVSPERLNRFFTREENGYRIRREVRELVVFAPHNLLGDPPFSRLDLISCRNLMIYLQRDVQRDVIELFHYALVPDGHLVLGVSESIESSDLFVSLGKKLCIYRKRNVPAPEPRLPTFPLARTHFQNSQTANNNGGQPMAYGVLHQQLVERYSFPSILVSPDDKIVYISERAGKFLTHPGGEITNSVYKLVTEELRIELRTALQKARQELTPQQCRPVSVVIGGDRLNTVLHVRPATGDEHLGFALVIFQERGIAAERDPEAEPFANSDFSNGNVSSSENDSDLEIRLRETQAELQLTKQSLQAIIEDFETSQEEMKASNEELQSANEELRSTMEELETSKEELQSMNEELQTVNQENRHKVEELDQLSNDLQNLLTSTDIATLFLDRQLRILRFTPRISELFNIRDVDRNRSLFDFTHRLGYSSLAADAQTVLQNLIPVEREVQDDLQRWYLTRILPYRSSEDRIEGVVITFVEITALKTIEHALRDSEERYRLLIDNALEYAIILFDLDGRISLWNRGAKRITGFTEEEAVGKSGDIIFTHEDREAGVFQQELETARQTGHAGDDRWQQRKNGTRFWANGVTMALRYPDGTLRGYAKVLRDNTAQKQAAESLREAEWRLRQALEAAELGTWSYDSESQTLQLDARAQSILGVERAVLSREELKRLLPEENFSVLEQAERVALHPQGGETFDQTMRIIKPGGEARWLRAYARVFFEGEGKHRSAVRAVGVIEDVSAETEFEETLRGSETRLRLAAEANGFGSYESQLPAGPSVWSREMYSIFDIPESTSPSSELVFQRVVSEDKQALLDSISNATSATGPSRHAIEFRIRRTDGQVRWLKDIGQTFFAGSGSQRHPVRVVGMVQDITDQKDFEQSLQAAREKAEAANRARGEFLANMSHEIRTPMSAILGYADVLLEYLEDPDNRNCVMVMKSNGEHLLQIINDILDLSRVEAGKLEIVQETVDLPELVTDVHALMRIRAEEKRLEFRVQYVGQVPATIQTDPKRVRQILFNLLGNAIKFTRDGFVALSVKLIQSDQQSRLQFAVSDSGIGMTAEQKKRLFKPFSQGDSSVTRSFGGSGLGLAISQRLVRMLGGEISVRSELGEGSTFVVELPIGPLNDVPLLEPTFEPSAPEPASPLPPPRRLECRVLVIDDRRDVRHISQHFLEKAGATVSTAEDGLEGIEAVRSAAEREQPFDLIVMDMQMPRMDGMQAVEMLRSEGFDLPIIALTADAMKGDRERCLRGGFDDYLSKPIDQDKLVRLVGKYTVDTPRDVLVQLRAARSRPAKE